MCNPSCSHMQPCAICHLLEHSGPLAAALCPLIIQDSNLLFALAWSFQSSFMPSNYCFDSIFLRYSSVLLYSYVALVNFFSSFHSLIWETCSTAKKAYLCRRLCRSYLPLIVWTEIRKHVVRSNVLLDNTGNKYPANINFSSPFFYSNLFPCPFNVPSECFFQVFCF